MSLVPLFIYDTTMIDEKLIKTAIEGRCGKLFVDPVSGEFFEEPDREGSFLEVFVGKDGTSIMMCEPVEKIITSDVRSKWLISYLFSVTQNMFEGICGEDSSSNLAGSSSLASLKEDCLKISLFVANRLAEIESNNPPATPVIH